MTIVLFQLLIKIFLLRNKLKTGTATFDFSRDLIKNDILFLRCKIIRDHGYYQEIKLLIYILTFKVKSLCFYRYPLIYWRNKM